MKSMQSGESTTTAQKENHLVNCFQFVKVTTSQFLGMVKIGSQIV